MYTLQSAGRQGYRLHKREAAHHTKPKHNSDLDSDSDEYEDSDPGREVTDISQKSVERYAEKMEKRKSVKEKGKKEKIKLELAGLPFLKPCSILTISMIFIMITMDV